MSIYNIMQQRCSVRSFTEQPVEKGKILSMLEAARIAPSACNNQPWHFIVVQDSKLRVDISDKWGEKASVIIVVCGDHRLSWKRRDGKDHLDIDVAIAVDHMTLVATELDLGTCWVCAFDTINASKVLHLPDYLEPVALLPVGYPEKMASPERHDSERKKLDEIISWDMN